GWRPRRAARARYAHRCAAPRRSRAQSGRPGEAEDSWAQLMTSGESCSMLPDLTADQARHSAAVARAVSAAIEAQAGWLAFDDYLRIVLYAPGLGYYSAGSVKFGPEGDFVTAPELSGLYARCLASQCAPVLRAVGGDVLELGAGPGRLAAGVLTRLAELEQLPRHYYILEVSADLRVRQSETLEGLPAALRSRVAWLDALPATPITGVVLANEVADALPFQRFVIDAEALYQRGVGLSDDAALVDADRPASAALRAELGRIAPNGWPRRYLFELCPGLQDITAWVDFTRVAEAAVDAQLEVAGFCTQAAFLLANGIEAELAAASNTLERARLASQARVLLLPGEMGERFKVMALTRGFDEPLCGFAYQDLRRSL